MRRTNYNVEDSREKRNVKRRVSTTPQKNSKQKKRKFNKTKVLLSAVIVLGGCNAFLILNSSNSKSENIILSKQLSTKDSEIIKLKGTIADLNNDIAKKEKDISGLNEAVNQYKEIETQIKGIEADLVKEKEAAEKKEKEAKDANSQKDKKDIQIQLAGKQN